MHEEFGCRYYVYTKTGEQWQEARDLNGNVYYFNVRVCVVVCVCVDVCVCVCVRVPVCVG